MTDLHEPTCMFYYTQVRVMTRSLHVSLVQCAVHASGTALERQIRIFLTAKVRRTWNNFSITHSVFSYMKRTGITVKACLLMYVFSLNSHLE